MFFILYFWMKNLNIFLIKYLLTWIYFGLWWVVVYIFWLSLGGGGWSWIYYGCRWVVDGSGYILAGGWLVVSGGGYILAGDGWCWIVVSLILRIDLFQIFSGTRFLRNWPEFCEIRKNYFRNNLIFKIQSLEAYQPLIGTL